MLPLKTQTHDEIDKHEMQHDYNWLMNLLAHTHTKFFFSQSSIDYADSKEISSKWKEFLLIERHFTIPSTF